MRLDDILKFLHHLRQGFCSELSIHMSVILLFNLVKNLIKFSVRDSQADFAEKLQKAAVSVVDEAFILGQGNHAFGGFVIEAQVEDGVHHARHGQGGTGTH